MKGTLREKKIPDRRFKCENKTKEVLKWKYGQIFL